MDGSGKPLSQLPRAISERLYISDFNERKSGDFGEKKGWRQESGKTTE